MIGPAHGVPAKDYVFVPAGCDETPHPFRITVDVMTGFAGGMSGKVDGFRVAEVPELVVISEAGTTGSVQKY